MSGLTREQFISKIYSNKIQNNMTNKQCAEVINKELGTNFQESYLRGIHTNYTKGYEDALENLTKNTSNSVLSEIKEELGELYITKQEVRNKTNKLNRIKRDFAKSIEIANDVKEYITTDLENIELFDFSRISSISNNKLIVQVSDWHIGYVINNYKGNTYNYIVAKSRLDKLIQEIKKTCELYAIRDVVVVNCGDIIENTYMRETQQAYECEFNMSEQISKATKLLYEFITSISLFANVKLASVGGNHSRMSQKSANIEGDNCNVVITETIKALVEVSGNDRVEVIETDYIDDSCKFEINGMKVKAIHGDNRVQDHKKLYDGEVSMDNEKYDLILRGHWHNFNICTENNGAYVVTAGCLFGSNPYSVKRMSCDTKASQTLIVVGEKEIEMIKNVILN